MISQSSYDVANEYDYDLSGRIQDFGIGEVLNEMRRRRGLAWKRGGGCPPL